MIYDFFLSYATQDDSQVIPGNPASQWVSTFREALKGRLQFFLKRPVTEFFDRRELAGNSPLTADLQSALDRSRMLVAISSPTYYERPWCKKERLHFIKSLGPSPVMTRRVIIIHTTDVDRHIAPKTWQSEFFPDVRGYAFYRPDRDGALNMLGFPKLEMDTESTLAYYREIERLAQEMAAVILAMESQPAHASPSGGASSISATGADSGGSAVPDPATAALLSRMMPQVDTTSAASGPSQTPVAAPSVASAPPVREHVYLAETHFSAYEENAQLCTALTMAGYHVRSGAELTGKTEAQLKELTGEALGFVQVVAPILLPQEGQNGHSRDEAQWKGATKAGLPVFRWRPLDLDIATAAQSQPGYEAFAAAPDVRRQLLPSFRDDLLQELEELRAVRRLRAAASDDGRVVLIAADAGDLFGHSELVTAPLKKFGLSHFITDTPATELNAEDVRGFLVLYGGTTAEWVRDRLTILRSLSKTRRTALPIAVYFCAPPPDLGARRLLFDAPFVKRIHWNQPDELHAFAHAVAS